MMSELHQSGTKRIVSRGLGSQHSSAPNPEICESACGRRLPSKGIAARSLRCGIEVELHDGCLLVVAPGDMHFQVSN